MDDPDVLQHPCDSPCRLIFTKHRLWIFCKLFCNNKNVLIHSFPFINFHTVNGRKVNRCLNGDRTIGTYGGFAKQRRICRFTCACISGQNTLIPTVQVSLFYPGVYSYHTPAVSESTEGTLVSITAYLFYVQLHLSPQHIYWILFSFYARNIHPRLCTWWQPFLY